MNFSPWPSWFNTLFTWASNQPSSSTSIKQFTVPLETFHSLCEARFILSRFASVPRGFCQDAWHSSWVRTTKKNHFFYPHWQIEAWLLFLATFVSSKLDRVFLQSTKHDESLHSWTSFVSLILPLDKASKPILEASHQLHAAAIMMTVIFLDNSWKSFSLSWQDIFFALLHFLHCGDHLHLDLIFRKTL